jgi:hypothetical protein
MTATKKSAARWTASAAALAVAAFVVAALVMGCSSTTPSTACPDGQVCGLGGSANGAGGAGNAGPTHGFVAEAPDFSLMDVNATSASYQQQVSPRDYLQQVSAWYFGHAT